jgi:hypothetical protein
VERPELGRALLGSLTKGIERPAVGSELGRVAGHELAARRASSGRSWATWPALLVCPCAVEGITGAVPCERPELGAAVEGMACSTLPALAQVLDDGAVLDDRGRVPLRCSAGRPGAVRS